MKKLINKLLIPTMLTSLTATMVSNCNVINLSNNINEINEVNTINEKDKLTNKNLTLMIFIDNLLVDDCLTNFQKYYRLNANDFDYLTYKDVAKKFELFLHEKYEIKFQILIKDGKYEYISSDKLNKIKINICLYKVKRKWKVLNSNLTVNIETNDPFIKLAWVKEMLKDNGYAEKTRNEKFNDVNEVIIHLKHFLNSCDLYKDIEVELDETFMTSSLRYCYNSKKPNPNFLTNFICLNLKINNYSMPVIITNLQTNFEIENLDDFKSFSNFNIFLKNVMPHINLKNELLNNGNIVLDYTYQDFINYLNNEYIEYWSLHEDMQENFPYIKLNENQNKLFINGKNIVNLLIAKNENCKHYIKYYLPIYWHEEIKQLPYNDFYFIEKNIFKPFQYPNSIFNLPKNNIIESNELKEGQPQKRAYNLILEKVKSKIIKITSLYQTISLTLINSEKLLEKNHNIISANIKFADYEYPIDFHIKLTNT